MAKSKKNKQTTKPELNEEVLQEETKSEAEVAEPKQEVVEKKSKNKEAEKKQVKQKKDKKVEKKPSKVKETVSELKKVTWPTFGKVVRNTLLVLGIVLAFTIVLFGIDFGLGKLYELLTKSL